jgi:GxxExxY protein
LRRFRSHTVITDADSPLYYTRRLSQKEFGALAYEVMDHVFAIHGEFGHFFDEKIYKKELAARMPGVHLEVYVDVVHETFSKRYFADVIVQDGGLFEFKAADSIHPRHRSQTVQYLLLFDLAHGKIVNVRTEKVGHEFVNCHSRLVQLRNPSFVDDAWDQTVTGAKLFRHRLTSLLNDWGTGLDLALYEEGLEHFFNKEQSLESMVPVFGASGHLADQRMRLVTPESAFKLTALSKPSRKILINARKLIRHTPLKAIHWANLTQDQITLTTIQP